MHVALGGTFDPVHDGHLALFERAFSLGEVTVGLTTDSLAPETRHTERHVRSYDERKADLDAELQALSEQYGQPFEIRPLTEPTGIAVEPQFDALVVSPETVTGAERINELRTANNTEPLSIEVVDHVPADDGKRISSTRIVNGEIDRHGNLTPDRTAQSRS